MKERDKLFIVRKNNGSGSIRNIANVYTDLRVDTIKAHKTARGTEVWRINGIKCIKGYKPNYLAGKTLVVNWGYGYDTMIVPDGLILNEATKLPAVKNKYYARVIMEQHGVNVPKTWWHTDMEPRILVNEDNPVIVRNYKHYGGKGYHICTNVDEIDYAVGVNSYIQEAISKKTEYRIHCSKWGMIRVQQKVLRDEDAVVSEAHTVRPYNHLTGDFVFKEVSYKKYSQISEVIIQAMKALMAFKLDIGAVDVMVDQNDKAYVLEVNTSPAIEGTTAKDYAVFFRCVEDAVEYDEVPTVEYENYGMYFDLFDYDTEKYYEARKEEDSANSILLRLNNR